MVHGGITRSDWFSDKLHATRNVGKHDLFASVRKLYHDTCDMAAKTAM